MSRAWIQFFIGDYLRDTRGLSLEEHGAYILMLCENWEGRSLPEDHEELFRIVNAVTDSEKKAVLKILDKYFAKTFGKLFNKKARKIAKITEEFIKTQSKNGSRGGRPRKANENPNQKPNESLNSNNNNKEKINKKEKKVSTLVADDWHPSEEFFAWVRENHPSVEGREVDFQLRKYKDYCHAQGKKYVNHEAALRNWFDSPYFKPGYTTQAATKPQVTPYRDLCAKAHRLQNRFSGEVIPRSEIEIQQNVSEPLYRGKIISRTEWVPVDETGKEIKA